MSDYFGALPFDYYLPELAGNYFWAGEELNVY